ncbi:MAG: hypothetical protein KBA53_12885 [Thermoclostridium sp.]|nr:hypothetical protein [Thermoclostridium sp.]
MFTDVKNLEFFNGFGGFTEDGKEYEIILDCDTRPPVPWINVIATKPFGFTISETGAGYTWAFNSRENKLTPWSNDPILDSCPEVIYIRDEITSRVMTPVSLGKKDKGPYRVNHGFGYTQFRHMEEEIEQRLTVFTPLNEQLKLWELELTNHTDRERYLTLFYYVEWLLGVSRDHTKPYVITSYDNEHEYMYARNMYNYRYRKHRAFIFSSEMITGYTGDKQEVLGLKGSVRDPQGLDGKFSCATGVCYDPCGVIAVPIAIGPKQKRTVLFGLGYSDDEEEIHSLCRKYKDSRMAATELSAVKRYWQDMLGDIQVKTDDRAIDLLVNGWLLYQTISCRIFARTAFYQCGGAYGFRDQLQDSMSLIFSHPEMLREQILLSSQRQFEQGDVQHWWHPPDGVGVRTRISDDLLWMPYATALYIRTTGDYSILTEKTNYIQGPVLAEDQHEMMFVPQQSPLQETLYEHCKKAIDHIRLGSHGLPLIGGGDWNDGMNEVGIEGHGESVWLGWFIITLLEDFIPLCDGMNDLDFADKLKQMRLALSHNIEEHAWDGEWYLRAFYDDGSKMGSKENEECRIDSISQSWSIISKAADPERAQRAFQSAWANLVLEKEGVSLLLTPPFNKTDKNPGYIKRYYPGIRENGGQYTHGAIWLAIAAAISGYGNKAHSLFTMLNPIHSTASRKGVLTYEKEPYVMTADISYEAPYTGRGGWSWYTGSAGWMYQGLLKWFLGFTREADELVLAPVVPESFGDYKIIYKFETSTYIIEVRQRSTHNTGASMSADISPLPLVIDSDGQALKGNCVKLKDDGQKHEITVYLVK